MAKEVPKAELPIRIILRAPPIRVVGEEDAVAVGAAVDGEKQKARGKTTTKSKRATPIDYCIALDTRDNNPV